MNPRFKAAQFPEKVLPLFKPAPFKVLHGGRGSAKTESFCRGLLTLAGKKKLFVLCAREIQKSIAESVHKTLADVIEEWELGWFWTVQQSHVLGANGSMFSFAGIKNNIKSIKSMARIDICACFEADGISDYSWEVLLPTVRRDPPFGPFEKGSEVWVEFNPQLDSDPTYRRWVVDPLPGTVVIQLNWRDNPWFPESLEVQRKFMMKQDYDSYLNVWEGKTRKTLKGAIYANELSKAILENRVNPHIKPDRMMPVVLSFDLGKRDMCCIWFWQQIGMDHYAVDYIDGYGHDFAYYIGEVQKKGYVIGHVYLPHDAGQHHPSAVKSIEEQARAAWPNPGQVVLNPRIENITLGINLVRSAFPRIHINSITCRDGLMGLQHYQYGTDDEKLDPSGRPERTALPLHNWASNPSDAFRCYFEGLADPEKLLEPQPRDRPSRSGQGWMR